MPGNSAAPSPAISWGMQLRQLPVLLGALGALSPDGKTIYVSNEETSQVTALDLASGAIRATVAVVAPAR